LPVHLGTDGVLELGEHRREPEALKRLSQLAVGQGAAELDQPPQALVRAPVDVEQDG
jgi:hypothetical protein